MRAQGLPGIGSVERSGAWEQKDILWRSWADTGFSVLFGPDVLCLQRGGVLF